MATRLFAAFGYDGTYLQGIAEATGTDLTWIHDTFGDKRDLYLAVIERASRAENAVVEEALSTLPAGDPGGVASALYALVGSYLDFCLAHPQIPALWMHRWLGDAADIPDLEERYADPLVNRVRDALREAARAGLIDDQVDPDLMVRTLIWSIYGYLYGETLAFPDEAGAGAPQNREPFLAHLHQLIDRMLRLPWA
ncbi:hypothetical protein GCM10017673_27270 [Streptosporangium violaceochromogenes]|nr:hypothetical protein GCM10017673_27270 [Streptosporangium violaceochromogenes]